MSNHIHLIANSPEGHLSDILRDFKKFTAKNIIENIQDSNESRRNWMLNRFQFNAHRHSRNENYQMWTHENHGVVIYSSDFAMQKLDYLHNKPVRAGIVRKPEEYIYSNAGNYAEMESVFGVIIMDINGRHIKTKYEVRRLLVKTAKSETFAEPALNIHFGKLRMAGGNSITVKKFFYGNSDGRF